MKQLLLVSWLLSLSAILGLPEVKADVRMPLIFGNHMVLQQDTRITIWGWADAGENIEVLFAGQKVRTTANADGTWQVKLKPVKTKKKNHIAAIQVIDSKDAALFFYSSHLISSDSIQMFFCLAGFKSKKSYRAGTNSFSSLKP